MSKKNVKIVPNTNSGRFIADLKDSKHKKTDITINNEFKAFYLLVVLYNKGELTNITILDRRYDQIAIKMWEDHTKQSFDVFNNNWDNKDVEKSNIFYYNSFKQFTFPINVVLLYKDNLIFDFDLIESNQKAIDMWTQYIQDNDINVSWLEYSNNKEIWDIELKKKSIFGSIIINNVNITEPSQQTDAINIPLSKITQIEKKGDKYITIVDKNKCPIWVLEYDHMQYNESSRLDYGEMIKTLQIYEKRNDPSYLLAEASNMVIIAYSGKPIVIYGFGNESLGDKDLIAGIISAFIGFGSELNKPFNTFTLENSNKKINDIILYIASSKHYTITTQYSSKLESKDITPQQVKLSAKHMLRFLEETYNERKKEDKPRYNE